MNLRRFRRWLIVLCTVLLLTESSPQARDVAAQARRLSDDYAFNATVWLFEAGRAKLEGGSLNAGNYLSDEDASALVERYRRLIGEEDVLQRELLETLAQSSLPADQIDDQVAQLDNLQSEQNAIQIIVESILQKQASQILMENGLTTLGMVFPPLTFHFSELPMALIVSPRDMIQQDANILLDPQLSLEYQIQLEMDMEHALDRSALVVSIGGLGYYPTMVMETTGLNWVAEVIIHEWVHNYLELRPLGWNYSTSPELRTMNETTANLIGKNMGAALIRRYYPELVPPEIPAVDPELPPTPAESEPPLFDFRAEMYDTRVEVDRLLALGEVDAAEAYMEERRLVFVENGYSIRRLNQAYFAFHGAYADEAVGAAGEDPVGEAVRQLWALSESPADFLRTMSWMNSFQDLLDVLSSLAEAG